MKRGHAEALMPLIARVMKEAGIAFAALDRIAVTTGPGSFTGLRVVAAMVQGLAFGADLGVIPVSDLAMLAQAEAERGDGAIVAALDARMGEVYWSAFQAEQGAIPHCGRSWMEPRRSWPGWWRSRVSRLECDESPASPAFGSGY